MKVETYTDANGSNMDSIEYMDGVTVEEIAEDLRRCYTNWDYAVVSDDDGAIETIIR